MYYIFVDGQQVGPLGLEDLKNYNLTADSRIWGEGLTEWAYVKNMPEVVSALSLDIKQKKPSVNGLIIANIIIQVLVTLSFPSMLEERRMDGEVIMVFMAVLMLCIIMYLISIFLLYQKSYRAAKILAVISCIPFVPIGLIGIFGMNKAVERVTDY